MGVAPDRVAERWWWWGVGCGQPACVGGGFWTGRSCADGLIGGLGKAEG